MATQRHSRTPATLTKSQQEALIRAAEADPDLRDLLERTFAVTWADVSFQGKVALIQKLQEKGFALGSLAGAMRGHRDFERELTLRDYGLDTEDRLRNLEDQVTNLHEEIAQRDQTIAALRAGAAA